MRPLFFTTREGGTWHLWREGELSKEELVLLNSKTEKLVCVKIQRELVHAFIFRIGDNYFRWDARNGWTPQIKITKAYVDNMLNLLELECLKEKQNVST